MSQFFAQGRYRLNNLRRYFQPDKRTAMCGSTPTRVQRIIVALTCFLSACTSNSGSRLLMSGDSSESCYSQISTRKIPKVSSMKVGTQVPFLDKAPAGSRVLGEFSINADFATILKALQYNAHRVGADAVVIKKLSWWDIKSWAEPETVHSTKTISPTDDEKKEYKKQLQLHREGKAKRPEPPQDKHETSEQFIPGHWKVQGGARLEALFLETPHPVYEKFTTDQTRDLVERQTQDSREKQSPLAISILDQAQPQGDKPSSTYMPKRIGPKGPK